MPVEAFRRLVPLWEHMTGIYGHKWASSYGEAVSPTWVRGCIDLTNEELAAGLRGCLKRSESTRRTGDDDWPPTLGDFRLLCRPYRPVYHEERKALPPPPRTPEQLRAIEDDIAKLRSVTAQATRDAEAQDRARRAERFKHLEREPGEDDEVGT